MNGQTRRGWVYGAHIGVDPDGVEWLTVLGSAYAAPVLAADAAGATWSHMAPVLALVEEIPHPGVTGPRGMAYRVIAR